MPQTMSVKMGADTVFVSGTVNGVDVPWQEYPEHIWRSTVERSDTGVYDVVITAWDELGRSKTYETTLHYGMYAITDRTQADVDRVYYLAGKWRRSSDGTPIWTGTEEELDEWNAGLRGCYNAEDMNRVGYLVRMISELLYEYGYIVVVNAKENWTMTDTPTETQCKAYLDNVQAIRDSIPVLPTTPMVPQSMDNLNYQKANNIEKILSDVYYLLQKMISAFSYSGELYSGEI